MASSRYLHERAELAGLVNAVATAQGLRPIEARNDVEQDPAASGRLLQVQRAARAAEQAAVESQATVQNLIDQLRKAQETIANQAATIMRLRARLELIENGIFVEVR